MSGAAPYCFYRLAGTRRSLITGTPPSGQASAPRLPILLPARDPREPRLHDLRHTYGTLLIAAGVPVKVVSERLGHARPAFTIDTYQHVLPGMQVNAARVFELLIGPGLLPDEPSREKTRENRRSKTA